jgi:sugar phosphate isomerase/epimerase
MKISFYTSTFNDRPIDEVLDFAAKTGFDAIEIDINGHVKKPENVGRVVAQARERGLEVAALTLFGNQLDPNVEKRRALRESTREFANAIAEVGAPPLVVFPGRSAEAKPDGDYADFADYARTLLAGQPKLTITIENWPGPDNAFIATTPAGWRTLLELVRERRFGIEFDPSHLARIGVDIYPAYDGVKDRVKIIHAKDASIDAARLQEAGYHGAGWWRYRLPGEGVIDWRRFLAHAKGRGFDGVVSVEHEDANFGWPGGDLAARRDGEAEALRHLRAALAA